MYTVISGTNRNDSNTIKVARHYRQLLTDKGIEAQLFSLQGVDVVEKNPAFSKLETAILTPAQKFIFVSPEYNGSIPGILKAMFDISDVKRTWWGKKALLTGVSTGRAGNLRGMDHLTAILHFMKVIVHPNKLPISVVDKLMDKNGKLVDHTTLAVIEEQLNEFIEF
ncbi:MAG TPA: NADPH-dependent FMN reductase [Puia sp.]|nr:NADPH-dependent FMN reductase [Puia sp.]